MICWRRVVRWQHQNSLTLGGEVVGCAVVINLTFLNGTEKLRGARRITGELLVFWTNRHYPMYELSNIIAFSLRLDSNQKFGPMFRNVLL